MPLTDPFFYICAIPAVIMVGVAKGGFGGGLALVGVPMLSLAIPPVQAAGILLPILLVMDAVGLFSYRAIYCRKTLLILVPAGLMGILFGYFTAAVISETLVRLVTGTIALIFVADYWFGKKASKPSKPHNVIFGGIWGAISGTTSFLAHAGGPPFQMYVLPLKLAPPVMAGTAVIFFAIINFSKVVPYYALGQFDSQNITTSLVLLPIAPLATLAGIKIVRHINKKMFYNITYAGLFGVALKLIWDGITGL
ncbi:Sulfite exporter TauE/SafE [Pseudovibrio axinellae]|uniref:Probable membrane transporter protein n=2 Tax=Pseudovibrio axinellae TaxID=989403 RepID=A0A166AAS9_9HYPH|nr:Sulfite exporter TauE/SafE [Pseudovibrio axinellae]SER22112.1 hypothetical protein SAMN05421798_10785 [Pseudovibrio axinellae]